MNKKHNLLTSIVLGGALLLGTMSLPAAAEEPLIDRQLQKPITSIINMHTYDFLKDKTYIGLMNNLGLSLLNENSAADERKQGVHFAIGNLDGDNIPELVVYEQRDFSNLDDQGALSLYKFKNGTYQQVDKIPMNYDNGCLKMVIGKAAPDRNAVFIYTGVGAHSETFYLFSMEQDKLKNSINNKKANLLSVYPNGEIKDIDNDGIIEFSTYMLEPASEKLDNASSDKMLVWYKWDGKDGVNFICLDKKPLNPPAKSDAAVVNQFNTLLTKGELPDALNCLKANISNLSRKDSTTVVENYLAALDQNLTPINDEFYKLQERYFPRPDQDIFIKAKLTTADLNNVSILNNHPVFKDKQDLQTILLKANRLGLKVMAYEGEYYFVTDYQVFVDLSDNASSELTDYLKIVAFSSNKPYTTDWDELAQRVTTVESFKMAYPYSNYMTTINQRYEEYLRYYLFGSNNTSAYDYLTEIIKPEALKSYQNIIQQYDGYLFADIVKLYTEVLQQNNNKVNDTVLEKMNSVIEEYI